MQGYLTRSHEQGFAGGEFCEVISTLTHDLTKARNQLVRLMNQVKPGGTRLYGGYYGPPSSGSNVRNRHRTPGQPHFGCRKEYPQPSPQPERLCRPMTVHGTNQFGQPQPRAPFGCGKPQPKAGSYSCERPQEKLQYSCESPHVPTSCGKQQQCDGRSDRSGHRRSIIKITFDFPEPDPHELPRCHRKANTCRSSKPACLQAIDPARLQGGACRRHTCAGTQFTDLLKDVTYQLRERRLASDTVRRF